MGHPGVVVVAAHGSPEEAAAVLAAVQVVLDREHGPDAPEQPWPYRSAWRRAAIDEGTTRADVS